MITLKNVPPPQPRAATHNQVDRSAAAIGEAEASLTRLAAVAIPLSIRAANAISARLPGLLARVAAAQEGTASLDESDELGKATSDLVNAATVISIRLLKVAMHDITTVVRAVNAAAAELGPPPRS